LQKSFGTINDLALSSAKSLSILGAQCILLILMNLSFIYLGVKCFLKILVQKNL